MQYTPAFGQTLAGHGRSAAAPNGRSRRKSGRRHASVATVSVVLAVFFGGLALTDAAQAAPEMGVAYHIKFRHSGKCLDVPSGTTIHFMPLQQHACIDVDNERFLLERTGMDVSGRQYYSIRNLASNQCLDTDWGENDGDRIMQYPCGASWTSQWFTLIRSSGMPDDYYKLMNYHSEKCVNVAHESRDNHAQIIQYGCDGAFLRGTENMQVRFFRFP